MSEEGPSSASGDIVSWLADRRDAHRFQVDQIPFSELDKWAFDRDTGNLAHESGRFFSIEGVRVRTSFGGVPEWEQPIINQPEIGFLGFITKEFDGVLHFLIQAKMEPGNINLVQLSPTLQATRSNFTCVHEGHTPPYLDYFADRSRSHVLVDVLQSEQGARFLRKRNRNIIVQVEGDIPSHPDYVWLTLGQILRAMRTDNVVNMDARTVLSCIPLAGEPDAEKLPAPSSKDLLSSLLPGAVSLHSDVDIISWFTELKFRYELEVERIPLRGLSGWCMTDRDIHHEKGLYFRVVACSVEADSREIPSWSQPLVAPCQEGLLAFVVREFDGVLHFLVQAKVEPGNFDIVEMAPTVQCVTGNYQDVPKERLPPFTEYVLSADPSQVRFNTLQSEEGGRFFRESNRNMIVEAGPDFPEDLPDNYIWMTAYQLKEFMKYNNFVNVQARCLLAGFLSVLGGRP